MCRIHQYLLDTLEKQRVEEKAGGQKRKDLPRYQNLQILLLSLSIKSFPHLL